MSDFDPQTYPAAVAALVTGDRLNSLGPGTPNVDRRPALAALDVESVVGQHALADRDMARACLSGLWLLNDFLDESHRISQEIETPTGSYWHGIMHRREPDYENSKYWLRRVGEHPVFAALSTAAQSLVAEFPDVGKDLIVRGPWDPFVFVDLCRQAANGGSLEQVSKPSGTVPILRSPRSRAPWRKPWSGLSFSPRTVLKPVLETFCQRIQRVEWELLFDYSYRHAIGR
jgi:hypothetical protein